MMKKLMGMVLVVAIICFTASFASAEYKENRDYFLGEIVRVDAQKDTITIFDYMDERQRTFVVENGVGTDLKPGLEVMVSVLKGTETAKKVKVIVQRSIKL